MKNKPTKECKHDISGNMDNEYCSKCGMKYGHRYPQQSILSTILKEADKSFDEKFGCRENCSCSIFDYMIEYWHSQIELAYNQGIKDAKNICQEEIQ
jgi:hypothetical protein